MDALPPCPYTALGVAKDATTASIKQQYRKLVLRLHPDKVQDPALKQAAADAFHLVQSAYEIVSDDDRRQRYDAQCKLEQLRRAAMDREGGGRRRDPDMRAGPFSVPAEPPRGGDYFSRGPERSGRMSPQFEERAPRYDNFFDAPRPTSRKDNDFDRASKRAPPREDPKKSKSSTKKTKENERSSREERSRRTDQDVRKERERKNSYAFQQSPTSDSDEYDRQRRQRAEEDAVRRARVTEDETRRTKSEEATASVLGEERAHKLFNQDYFAKAYMATNTNSTTQERPTSERRPSPNRKSSSREDVEYIKRKDGKPPVMIRRGSGRPESSREPRKSSSRDKDFDFVEEPEEMPTRRPPTLNKTNSSPPVVRPTYERQRSGSLQFDSREPPIPQMKRAETMPYPQTNGPSVDPRSRRNPSKLQTELRPQDAYPTPETSPEPPAPRKGSYGQAYATDEYDDVYRTETREPAASPRDRLTSSPPPMDEPRERSRRSARTVQPSMPRRTTSTQYAYPASPVEIDEGSRRPSLQRESSSRLFGEGGAGTTSRSPRPSSSRKYSPPTGDVSWSPKPRMEDVRMSTGNRSSRARDSPHTSRQATPVYAK